MSYSKMTIAQLKVVLQERGLPVSGKKPELIERLEQHHDEDKDEQKDGEGELKGKGKAKKENEEDDAEVTKRAQQGTKRKAEDDVDAEDDAKDTKREKKDTAGDILSDLKEPGWKEALSGEWEKAYFKEILRFLQSEESSGKQVFPPQNEIFAALNYTPFDKVRVVIIGQDPYHDDDQANGLCFSVREGIKHPPSLVNIFKELTNDIQGGSLEKWAHRGVLLLNASLTVQAHHANSHAKCGWMTFTDEIIRVLSKKGPKGIVFILWGGFAQKKSKLIAEKRHFVINAAHPSPLSQGKFFGCKVFSKTNDILKKEGYDPIDWTL